MMSIIGAVDVVRTRERIFTKLGQKITLPVFVHMMPWVMCDATSDASKIDSPTDNQPG